MKTSCIPICFFEEIQSGKMPLSEWLAMAADIGLDGTEVYRPFLQAPGVRSSEELADQVHEAGLEVSMFTSYGQLAVATQKERRKQIQSINRDVDQAGIFQTSIVRMTAGDWPPDCSRDEALRNVARCLKEALDYAEEKGVMIALEDHHYIGTSTKDFTTILDLVDDERLKVNLDTSNPMTDGEDAIELAGQVGKRVVHVHASDRDERLEHSVAGEGCVPFPEIFQALKAAGFDGWISLEAGSPGGKKDIIEGIRYIKKVWEGA